ADGASVTLWDVRVVKPLDPDMLADAARHRIVITVEDGIRDGGAGDGIRDALCALGSTADVRVLGTPVAYIPHGKPDAILAELGLDADGIERTARAALGRTPC